MGYQEMNNSNLEFRKIPSLKFLYEVNSNGTIFRNVKSKKQLKIKLDFHHSKDGYYATFVRIGGRKPEAKTIRVMIHSVVAECWLGKRPDGYQVDHIDRNSHNNDYRNLRYVTHSEQMKNRDYSGISSIGTKNCLTYVRSISKPVILSDGEDSYGFQSIADAARFLSASTGMTEEHCRFKLKKRRSHIYQYAVKYPNAETKHDSFTEQEIVQ